MVGSKRKITRKSDNPNDLTMTEQLFIGCVAAVGVLMIFAGLSVLLVATKTASVIAGIILIALGACSVYYSIDKSVIQCVSRSHTRPVDPKGSQTLNPIHSGRKPQEPRSNDPRSHREGSDFADGPGPFDKK